MGVHDAVPVPGVRAVCGCGRGRPECPPDLGHGQVPVARRLHERDCPADVWCRHARPPPAGVPAGVVRAANARSRCDDVRNEVLRGPVRRGGGPPRRGRLDPSAAGLRPDVAVTVCCADRQRLKHVPRRRRGSWAAVSRDTDHGDTVCPCVANWVDE